MTSCYRCVYAAFDDDNVCQCLLAMQGEDCDPLPPCLEQIWFIMDDLLMQEQA